MVKIHSRCNLSCDHCYVYTSPDDRWRDEPRGMSPRIMEALAHRLTRYTARHRPPSVTVVLHGGEPLLAGVPAVSRLIGLLAAPARHTDLRLVVQTNGLLLDEAWLELFRAHDVRVGVSLDGDREANDRHRRHADGRSSHDAVVRALRLLRAPRYRHLYAGVLCTVDPRNDPLRVYRGLVRHRPPRIDLLLPHANREHPPPDHDPATTPYARWLLTVFDQWYGAPRRETRVRIFEDIMTMLLGGRGSSEGLGLSAPGFLVVGTGGSIERPDSLLSAYPGAVATGTHVLTHDFDQVVPLLAPSHRGLPPAVPAGSCRRCPVGRVCGGGLPAHRYHPMTGFDNPSVYCADLFMLITSIRERLARDLPTVTRSTG
ncbi:FxsB family radical SAM/SPASM domain protein [Streptomyces calidiresistens]|uniref:FxsB family radical SAM/SPASM domain protein n=1 Tax=Streptomyces calidiresistens TaxID=1485586 RepID=A0A7W3T7M4_9ACTN|nr:FxsB family radical SAM/SPASM domain protein [Streptomyces calidiresistens]